MQLSIHAIGRFSLADRFAQWWRGWTLRRRTLAQLNRCGPTEVERMAHDVGVSAQALRALAGKWPGAADLLVRRLAALGVDPAGLANSQPHALHDLQRVCTLCAHTRRCEHDLTGRPTEAATWRSYCPNTATLDALAANRKSNGKAG